jgi:tRNA A-37 threonylcarbamoyl transferase component Bud32
MIMKFVILGPERDQYEDAVKILLDGQLPSGWEWVDSSANSVVARQLEPKPVYFKEFLSRTPFEGIKNILRGSRCQRAISKGEMLRKRGFHTPLVYCWGETKGRHFMITEGIDAPGLGDYISRHRQQTSSGTEISEKRRLIRKFGKKIGELHKNGICHGDLRANNILVQKSESDIIFYFLDNERNAFYSKIPGRLIRKNLVQLNMTQSPHVTRQDRLRFFQAYCDAYGELSAAAKSALIQRVQGRTAERLAQKAEKERRAGKSSR